MDQSRPASQKFPAGLAGVLNHPPENNRDSAYYSSTDSSSKHTSAASGMSVLSPAGGFHSPDKTPSPTCTNHDSQVLASPVNSHMSVASIMSPTGTVTGGDVRRCDRPMSLDSAAGGGYSNGDIEAMSRRESVDSRMNQGFNDMRLGNSPYASHNQSSTSIHNALATAASQRKPRSGFDRLSMHRISNGYQPYAERNPDLPKTRLAPTITGPATSQIARAAEPTKGQAWAFPEEDMQRLPGAGCLIDSRRSSVADSLTSSQFTESRLPPGQRRLDDGPGGLEYHGMSNLQTDFPAMHHHSLHHKKLGELQGEDGAVQVGAQPYSRTPELRVSHKLAERKRRTEMKELFEQLKDLMPQERGSKASKWEILTKAITEHQRQVDSIRSLQGLCSSQLNEMEMMKRELHALRMENDRLRGQPPQISAEAYGDQYEDHYGRPRPEQLPPLRSLQPATGPTLPDSMTGLQYDPPRMKVGFRLTEPPRF